MKGMKYLAMLLGCHGMLTTMGAFAGEYAIGPSGQTEDTGIRDNVLVVNGFVDGTGKLVSRNGRFSVARTGEMLFFHIVTELPPEGGLVARVSPEKGGSNAVALDDTVEIWLSPLSPGEGKAAATHQLMVNPLGAVYSARHNPSAGAPLENWKHGAVLKSKLTDDEWHVEAAIPLASIDPNPGALEGVRFRVARNWRRPTQASASEAFAGGGYANPETMSRLYFRQEAPAVNFKNFLATSRKALDLQIALTASPAKAESLLDVEVNVESTSNVAPRFQNESFTLTSGQHALFKMENRLETDTDFDAKIRVSDGEKILFQRQFSFSTQEPKDGWNIIRDEAPSRFRIAYSPYRNLLLVEDLENSAHDTKVEITGAGGTVLSMPLEPGAWRILDEHAVAAVPLPGLEAGDYAVRLSQSETSEAHPLTVERFGWEHNDIGKGGTVPPPFTPVHVEGKTASVLLREYTFNDAALPAAIHAEKIPVLHGEAKIEARINGKPESLTAPSMKLSSEEAVFTSEWNIGAVHGRTTSSMDEPPPRSLSTAWYRRISCWRQRQAPWLTP